MNTNNSVMALATTFADRGDWTVEQQFVLQMGSSYLLAHGIGTPLQRDAVTTVEVPADGEYNLLVRTKNWTKHWSDGPTPGIFQVLVDGVADAATFGTDKVDWYWQRGGKIALKKGKHTLALHDLTGFDGRCDAVVLTTSDEMPGDSLDEYRALRARLLGPETPVDKGEFDFVVVGGGISGICAALAAARLGCKVALVQDRYVLGGKRESRRLLGEFVLREQDLMNFTIYPDGTASTSWYIDQHYPDPENSKLFPGREYLSCGHLTPLSFYPIPYRCFYSKDVDNLFMAGRNISVSHVALGTVRVMRTTAMMGEVVGMAASICSKHGALPHDVYDTRFEELRELMQRGAGRTDVPYLQVYTLIDTTAARSEEC